MFENVVNLDACEDFFEKLEKKIKNIKNLKGYYSIYKTQYDLGKFLTLYNDNQEIYIWLCDSSPMKVIIGNEINNKNNGYSQKQFKKAKSFTQNEYDKAIKYTVEKIKNIFA